jgi:hypothetical protein
MPFWGESISKLDILGLELFEFFDFCFRSR